MNEGTGKAIPPQFGKKHSEIFKQRQSLRMKEHNPMVGRVQSENEKRLRQEMLKRPRSEKAKERIRQSKMGNLNPNFGKTNSLEYCKRMSERLKGRKFSDEHKEKLKGPKTKILCSKCGMPVAPHILSRYHNEKCKRNYNVI